jgi:hypothetical protein
MELSAILEQIERERRVEIPAGGATFQVKLPSEYAWRVAIESHTDAAGRTQFAAVSRVVLEAAVVGWSGVTARHFGLSNDEAVACSAQALLSLLEWRSDISDDLITEISRLRRERAAKFEAAQKN